jgi:hypothetical protein
MATMKGKGNPAKWFKKKILTLDEFEQIDVQSFPYITPNYPALANDNILALQVWAANRGGIQGETEPVLRCRVTVRLTITIAFRRPRFLRDV